MFHEDWTSTCALARSRATVKGYCQSAASVWKKSGVKMTQESSWSTHGNLHIIYKLRTKRDKFCSRHAWWLKLLHVRAIHKLCSRDSAHTIWVWRFVQLTAVINSAAIRGLCPMTYKPAQYAAHSGSSHDAEVSMLVYGTCSSGAL